jgi:dynactin complex subunit
MDEQDYRIEQAERMVRVETKIDLLLERENSKPTCEKDIIKSDVKTNRKLIYMLLTSFLVLAGSVYGGLV